MATRKVASKPAHVGPTALIAARFSDCVSLFDQPRADLVSACIQHVGEVAEEHPEILLSGDDGDFWPEEDDWLSSVKPYKVTGGVLSIPVKGVLLNNFDYQLGAYATGYQYIEEAFNRGESDPEVKGIVLNIDSPGGQASGNFELVEHITSNKTKPLLALVNGSAYSGGYSIATAGDSIVASSSSGVGSIGVVTSHVDVSKAMEKQGVNVTFIFAGKHKVDGNPYEPLPAAVKDRIQTSVNETYGVFVDLVARNRGMDEQAVRDTEAETYTATEGLGNGLIDSIETFKAAMAGHRANVNGNGATVMANISQEDHDKAVKAARDEATLSANTAAKTQAAASAKAERDRIKSIITSDEAKNKQSLATELAYSDDNLSVETCKRILTAAAPETAAAAAPATSQEATNQAAFDKAVGAGAGVKAVQGKDKGEAEAAEGGALDPEAVAASIVADYAKAGGAGLKTQKREQN